MSVSFVPTLTGAAAKTFKPPACPDIDVASWWPDAPWTRPADGPVDAVATAALATIPGSPAVRASTGVPYQVATLSRVEVVGHHELGTYGAKNETLPMPDAPLRRTGDPDGSNTDRQAFLVDQQRGLYIEVSNIIPASIPVKAAYGLASWLTGGRVKNIEKSVDRVSVFDLSKRWDLTPMNGTAAITVPMLPMVPTYREFAAGHIGHALQVCVTHYRPKVLTGYARSTDGGTPSSPLAAGMVLRLAQHRYEQLLELWARRPHVVALLSALHEHGMVVADGTTPSAGHLLRIAQDPRIDIAGLTLTITDFEVLA